MTNSDSMLQAKGFFGSLFDFSFSSFITLRFIKILYVIGMIVVALGALGVLITFAREGLGGFLVGLVLAAAFFIVYLIAFRLVLELVVVIFRIGENTSILVHVSTMAQGATTSSDPTGSATGREMP